MTDDYKIYLCVDCGALVAIGRNINVRMTIRKHNWNFEEACFECSDYVKGRPYTW